MVPKMVLAKGVIIFVLFIKHTKNQIYLHIVYDLSNGHLTSESRNQSKVKIYLHIVYDLCFQTWTMLQLTYCLYAKHRLKFNNLTNYPISNVIDINTPSFYI